MVVNMDFCRNSVRSGKLRNFGDPGRLMQQIMVLKKTSILVLCCAAVSTSAADQAGAQAASEGVYRLPYADGVSVKVFDDVTTHRPQGRIDLFAVGGERPYKIVAAARGRVAAIQDRYQEKQTGRAAAECRNNYIWIEHENGEWTNYSHLARGSVTEAAKLNVGDWVEAGAFIGIEGTVGCSMLDHVHFEVAVPDVEAPIDSGGFLLDNEGGKRLRNPRFCKVPEGKVVKDAVYRAVAC
jgi:murein DD-endopeptidase MepM/ murein hydrolase activator NlpD